MEENRIIEFEQNGQLDILNENIIPHESEIPKKKISIYYALTISVFIFVIAFLFADISFKITSNNAQKLPTLLLTKLIGEEIEAIDLSISEYFSTTMLGITKSRANKLMATIKEEKSDEQSSDTSQSNHLENEEPQTGNDNQDIPVLENPEDTETNQGQNNPDSENRIKYPIVAMDLSQSSRGLNYIMNETSYNPDIGELLENDKSIPVFSDSEASNKPLVLIIHTHGTESYSEEKEEFYIDDGSELWRTTDTNKNMIFIGKRMAEILNDEGVNTIHCEIMHDKESYQDSYLRAAETIKTYLAKYPSIKYVFDIHRDAILKPDGTLVKAVTNIDGESTAQVMTVVGSNYKGANFPDWENHLSLALKLREKLAKKSETLSRPVYLRGAAYNQQYTPGSLLIEIGTSGNTLSEAVSASELVAQALADIIKGK